jgi:hypothetical protein
MNVVVRYVLHVLAHAGIFLFFGIINDFSASWGFCAYPFAIPVVGALRSLRTGESLLMLIVLGYWAETCFFHLPGGTVTLFSVATYAIFRCRRRPEAHHSFGSLLSINALVHVFLGIHWSFSGLPFRGTSSFTPLAASWIVTSVVGHLALKTIRFFDRK